jgi:hypothetical protein
MSAFDPKRTFASLADGGIYAAFKQQIGWIFTV